MFGRLLGVQLRGCGKPYGWCGWYKQKEDRHEDSKEKELRVCMEVGDVDAGQGYSEDRDADKCNTEAHDIAQ